MHERFTLREQLLFHISQSIHIYELHTYIITSNNLGANPVCHIERDKLYVDLNQSAH